MFARLALAVVVALAGHATAQEAPPITLEIVRAIEKTVVMPSGARVPLEAYNRYYSLDRIDGRVFVVGTFLLRSKNSFAGRVGSVQIQEGSWVLPRAPPVVDGGCSVITVLFDVETQRLVPIYQEAGSRGHNAICNGIA